MSNKAINWAWSQKVSWSEKLLLVCLADYFNDAAGKAWPTQTQLEEKTGLSQSTLFRATRKLKDKGLIKTSRKVIEGKSSRYNYTLDLSVTVTTSQSDYQSERPVTQDQPVTETTTDGSTSQADGLLPVTVTAPKPLVNPYLLEISPTVEEEIHGSEVTEVVAEFTEADWDELNEALKSTQPIHEAIRSPAERRAQEALQRTMRYYS